MSYLAMMDLDPPMTKRCFVRQQFPRRLRPAQFQSRAVPKPVSLPSIFPRVTLWNNDHVARIQRNIRMRIIALYRLLVVEGELFLAVAYLAQDVNLVCLRIRSRPAGLRQDLQ